MQTLLIHPPLADPTQPYLSLPTLKAALRARGLDARVLDLNLEATHHLLEPSTLESIARRIGSRFIDLNRTPELSFAEQREYRAIVEARPKIEDLFGASPSPIEVFQDRELFFDPAHYSLARRRMEALFDALGAAHFPYRFGFNHVAHSVLPWSFDLIDEYVARRASPFDAFYRRYFGRSSEWDWSEGTAPAVDLEDASFIGISVVFPSQIPEAFYLARLLRQLAPQAFVAFGGPCIHQIVVHMEPELAKRVLGFVDAVGLFEGEETLASLLPKLDEWRTHGDAHARARLLSDVPNLMTLDPASGAPHTGPRHTLRLSDAPAPDYSDLDLDRYLAPTRILLYAPTRGCYWNQCSFCYYGLAETATASYREIPADRAAADLAQLSRRYGVKNFYLSCDVLSPAYAVKLANALIERGVKIRWSSDLKIEKHFTPERCELLHRAGLRSAAFGIESGSDRILELMRKGTDRATMTAVNRAFHEAGVATEWMTFTDHPDESVDEAIETVRWIEEEQDHVDLFIIGRFGLERGSDIAQDPARYGIRKIYYAEGDELRLYALYSHRSGRRSKEGGERVEREVRRIGAVYDLHPYPWAGAVSTHHTFLHFLELGQRAFRTHFQRAGAALFGAMPTPPQSHITGLRERPRFSLQAIAATEERFFSEYLERAMYTTVPVRRGSSVDDVSPLSISDLEGAAARVAPLRDGKR